MARTKEDALADKAKDTKTKSPARRGRPASGKVTKAPYVPTGRPRGRPKGDGPPKAPYVPTGRPAGRPKGAGKKLAAQARAAHARAARGGGNVARPRPRKSTDGAAAAAPAAKRRLSKKAAAAEKSEDDLGEDVDDDAIADDACK